MESQKEQENPTKRKRLITLLLALALLLGIAACLIMRFDATPSHGLVINEVVSSNRRSLVDAALGTPDWIELYNGGDTALELAGCGLSDSMRELHKYVFPAGTVVPAGGYLVVYATGSGGETPSTAPVTGFNLSKNGEYLLLTDAYDTILAELELPALKTDISYARRENGSYGYCALPTPGAANARSIAVSMDALFDGEAIASLELSEVMPRADGSGYAWAELHNTGTAALSLENYCISDSKRNLARFQLPATVIAPGGYAAVYISGLGEDGAGLHTSFKLGTGENALYLADLSGTLLSSLSWDEAIPSGVSVVTGEGVCYTAYPSFEAANSTAVFSSLTISAMPKGAALHISEVQKTNRVSLIDADGDRPAWAELHNTGDQALSLAGYFLSDDAAKPFKWALPDRELAGGAYIIVYLSGKDRSDPNGELHASFGLSAEEDTLYLTCLDGMLQESVPLSGLANYSISVGLDEAGEIRFFSQPTPGSANGRGFEMADSIGYFYTGGVFISEVAALSAPRSGGNDWIELYNGGSESVTLTGWYLSDDPGEPRKWRFPETRIGAGEYLVVEASAHITQQEEAVACFGISAAGETLLLSDADGMPVDSFDTGALENGVSAGRFETDASVRRVFFEHTTRGKKNDEGSACLGYSTLPCLSDTVLYHTEPFAVTIDCADQNAAIYYTLDGSEPTQRDTLYSEPIRIEKNTVLRAASFKPGARRSQVVTADYIFDVPHTIPVLCIDSDPGDMRAVLSVSSAENKTERAALVSYFEADGAMGLRFPCGVRVKGAGTLVYVQKSLSLNLRAGYGQSEVTYPFFDNYAFHRFSALALRNGGQDWNKARMRDAFCQNLVEAEGLFLDNTPTRPVAVYINGVYWGLYDLSEDQNSEYLAAHYGVDEDAVDIIRRNSSVLAGSGKDFARVKAYAMEKDLARSAYFDEFAKWVDVAYFTDYLIVQSYLSNTDMFNQKYWRSQDYAVKWRPVFYDLDFGYSSLKHNPLSHFFSVDGVPSANGTRTYFEISVGLKHNRAWRSFCAERYVEVVMTYFNAERATAIFDAMVREREDEMPRQIARWGVPYSMEHWRSELRAMRKIVEQRPDYALRSMASYFGLSNDELAALIAKYK